MLKDLSDKKFFKLIFSSGDRLGFDYVEEAKRRREKYVPLLCSVLENEKNYKRKDERFWGVVHAVYLLGIIGDIRSIHALQTAGKFSQIYSIDWIWEALPECYLRLGPEAIGSLMNHLEKAKGQDFSTISSEVLGLWNLWDRYPECRVEIEDFLLEVIKDRATHREVRAYLMGDFAEIGRKDLLPLFEGFFERGEVALETLTREDLDQFLERDRKVPGHRKDLERFYDAEEIERRQRRWQDEEKARVQRDFEAFILERSNRIGRDKLCPCGSGEKFKKCHLPWALEERLRRQEEEAITQEQLRLRAAVRTERESESALRRFLSRKGQTTLFQEIKEKALELIKTPHKEFSARGFSSNIQPVLSRIDFENEREAKAFMEVFMAYFNALSEQFSGFPEDGMMVH
jgi:hypothetical protein